MRCNPILSALVAATAVAAACEEPIRFLGRVNPATRELTWPSSGLAFTFTGTSASIDVERTTGQNSVELTVDGEPLVILAVDAGKPIETPELPFGNHTVSLRKRSEAQYGTIFLGEVTSDGTLHRDTAPERQIEIIGDSISVGYGLDGVLPCVDSAAMQNNPLTYGAVAAKSLDADYSVVAWSGKGLVRNIATGNPEDEKLPLIPALYSRYGANDADGTYTFPDSWHPDVVVINLGTNDWSYLAYNENGSYPARDAIDPATFTEGMIDFVREIQTHYPEAVFFLLNSPMLGDSWPTPEDAQRTSQTNAIHEAIELLDDDKVHFLDWPQQGSSVGCDYHPNAPTNAAQAKVLAAAISEVLGW